MWSLGAVLRFATLGAQSYWFDEAQAAHELHLSLGSMLSSMVAVETAPPLYFVLGWVWAHLFGAGEVALRSLSALAGTPLIALAYLCGRELVSRRAGPLTAALRGGQPVHDLVLAGGPRVHAGGRVLRRVAAVLPARLARSHGRNIAWWTLFSVLALLTHYFAGFLVAPEALWLLYIARSRASVVAAGVVGLVELALIPLLVNHATASLLGFITGTHLSTRVQEVPVAFALGPPFETSLLSYGLIGAAALAAVLIVLLIVGGEPDELRGVGVASRSGRRRPAGSARACAPGHRLLHRARADPGLAPARDRGRRPAARHGRCASRARSWPRSCWPASPTA